MLVFSVAYPGEAGGVQGVVKRLVASLRRRGHTVFQAWAIANPDTSAGDMSYSLAPPERQHGLPTPRSIVRQGRSLLSLGRSLLRHRPQIVNVHFVSRETAYFVALRRLLRYRLVLSVHGSDVFRPNEEDAAMLPKLLPKADAITAVTPLLGERVREFAGVDPAKVHVIPNGVDYDFWSATVRNPELSQLPPTVMAVGRLAPVKGQDVLLRAFVTVRERVPEAKLVLVGGGPQRAELESLAGTLGLAEAVEFAGELPPEGVRTRMADAHAFALPSRSEGLPLALLEAMAAGVPAVATRVGGVPDVLEPGTGRLVPPEDPAALGEALAALLLDPAEQAAVGARAKERARHFSAAVADAAYEALFRKLIG